MLLLQLGILLVHWRLLARRAVGRGRVLVLVDLRERARRLFVGELEDARGQERFRVERSASFDVVVIVLQTEENGSG